jgi:dephospho-CoA kinase
MIVLGLTGGIGMGKTTTAQMFRDAGVPVWDADAAVHRLYTGGAAVAPMAVAFPKAVTGNAIDRTALKQIIATDPSALKRIEAIVHPLVAEDRAAFLAKSDAPLVVLDIPLLLETGTQVDRIAVVTVAPKIQKARVMARGTMTAEQFEMIQAKQMPDAEKRKRADYLIETDTLDTAQTQVRAIIAELTHA